MLLLRLICLNLLRFLQNLKKFYDKTISEEKITEIFEKNKSFYTETFKDFKYAELSPLNIIGENNYNEVFFNKINEIENKILDGVEFNQIIKDYNLNESITGLINQENKSNLDKYKKDIQENIINKISQDIIIKLQSI